MYVDEDVYLEHFGVKGMKWGVRKSSAARTRSKNKKAASRKELKAARKLTLGEAAVSAIFAGPVGILGYKALKMNTAKQKQASRDKGGDAKAQSQAAKVNVGAAVALSIVATPATGLLYVGAKTRSNVNVKPFEAKKPRKS